VSGAFQEPRESFDTSKRALRSEVLVVLGLSFFVYAAFAALQYAEDVTRLPIEAPVTVRYVPPEFDGIDYARRFLRELTSLVPVALVAHVLARSGESMRRIGFDLTRPVFDVTFGIALVVVTLVASTGLLAAAHTLDLPLRPLIGVNADAHWSATPLLLLSSAVAGVSEEVIVNGYLLIRLADLGWGWRRALAASALLRGSYHIYQGIGGFGSNIVIGLVAGRIFQRTNRIMPLVIAHFLNDVVAFAVDFFWTGRPDWLR
jgi:membrane protease YdiL (CAAX protease family)